MYSILRICLASGCCRHYYVHCRPWIGQKEVDFVLKLIISAVQDDNNHNGVVRWFNSLVLIRKVDTYVAERLIDKTAECNYSTQWTVISLYMLHMS